MYYIDSGSLPIEEEHPRSCYSEKVFLINFHLAEKIWGTHQLKQAIVEGKDPNLAPYIAFLILSW